MSATRQSILDLYYSVHAWLPDAITVFTGLLVVTGWLQFKLLRRSERIAETTADAARQSAEVAKAALVSVQRPFLFIDTFDVHILNNEYHIAPRWKNAGSTQANPVTMYTNWKTFPGEPPANYDYPDLAPDGTAILGPGKGVSLYMGPNDTIYTEPMKIPFQFMEQVRSGQLRLFIWGWVEYRDIFDGTPVHKSQFCNEVIATKLDEQMKDGKVTMAMSFPTYGTYNIAN